MVCGTWNLHLRSYRQRIGRKMGVYAKYVLRRLIGLAVRNKDTARLRAEWLLQAQGDVPKMGIGSWLNLRYYSPEVRHVYGVDPSVELHRMAVAFEVTFLQQSAEEPISPGNSTIDTAVVTWTFRSTPIRYWRFNN